MATLTTQNITRAMASGITTTAAAAGGDAMECGSGMMLEITNGSGVSINVTVLVPSSRTYEPNVLITSPALAVPAGQSRRFGPVDAQTFMDPTTGLATINYSAVTSVTVAATKLTQP